MSDSEDDVFTTQQECKEITPTAYDIQFVDCNNPQGFSLNYEDCQKHLMEEVNPLDKHNTFIKKEELKQEEYEIIDWQSGHKCLGSSDNIQVPDLQINSLNYEDSQKHLKQETNPLDNFPAFIKAEPKQEEYEIIDYHPSDESLRLSDNVRPLDLQVNCSNYENGQKHVKEESNTLDNFQTFIKREPKKEEYEIIDCRPSDESFGASNNIQVLDIKVKSIGNTKCQAAEESPSTSRLVGSTNCGRSVNQCRLRTVTIQEVPGKYKSTTYHVGDGYFYYRKLFNLSTIFLRCAISRTCPGRAKMPRDPAARPAHSLLNTQPHNHPPNLNWLAVQDLRRKILRRCQETATPFQTIHREECERVPAYVAAELPYKLISSSMYRIRSPKLTPVPSTLLEYGEELVGSQLYGNTMQGEPYYRATLVDEDNSVAVVFVSPTLSARLPMDRSHIHIDSMNRVVPSIPPSSQLLTLSAIHLDHAFPVVSVLMAKKTEKLYDLVFTYIKETNPDWSPNMITCNYEKSLTNALKRSWPNSSVCGCWFHSANSMNKKISSLGHIQFLQQNPAARYVYKMCQALPLLPAQKIQEGYDYIVMYAHQEGVLQRLAVFLNHVHRVWLTGIGVELFSVYKQRGRRNNYMETYRRKLRNTMKCAKPNVWIFTSGLRVLEQEAVSTLASLQKGSNAIRPQQPAYHRADRKIDNLTKRLDDGWTVSQFLEAASHQLGNVHAFVYNVLDDLDDEEGEDEDEDVNGLVSSRLSPDVADLPVAPNEGGHQVRKIDKKCGSDEPLRHRRGCDNQGSQVKATENTKHLGAEASPATSRLVGSTDYECSVNQCGLSTDIIQEVRGKYKSTIYHVGDGNFYYRKIFNRNRWILRCAISWKCPGRASLHGDPAARSARSLFATRPHNHPPNPNWLAVQDLRKKILRRCEETAAPFRTIHREECQKAGLNIATELPYSVVASSMYRARHSALGPTPSTLLENGEALAASERQINAEDYDHRQGY